MFKNKSESETLRNGVNASASVNLLGVGTVIEGEVTTENDIRIDGKIIGTVHSKAKVVVGTTGIVEGDVYCKNADISGKVTGKVDVKELLFLKDSAVVDGDISTNKFVVEAGAKFNGSCNMGMSVVSNNTLSGRNEPKTAVEQQATA